MDQAIAVRIWVERVADELREHTLVMGDLSAECSNCHNLGLDFDTVKNCPECNTAFRFATSRQFSVKSGRFKVLRRLRKRRPDLELMDYDDFKQSLAKESAHSFFNNLDLSQAE